MNPLFLVPVKYFKRPERGLNIFGHVSDRFPGPFFFAFFNNFPEAPAILFLRSDLIFRSDLVFALAGKCENKIGSKNKIGS